MKKRSLLLISLLIATLSSCKSSDYDVVDSEAAALARMKLGLAYLAQADQSEDNIKLAYYNLKKAEHYSPNNPKIMLAIAMFDQRVSEYQEAEKMYQRIIEKDPKNGLYRMHYATFLCAKGDYQQASLQFQYAINFDPHRWKADSLEQYGYCAIQHSDLQTASMLFKQLFEYDRNRRKNVVNTAKIYQTKGDEKIANYLFSIINQ